MTDIIRQYYNQERTDYGINSLRRKKLLELVGNASNKRILDIGCSKGYVGEELKRRNNLVYGIDISESAILEAKTVLDNARILDIENNVWPKDFLQNKFDVIICAEVVEHLFDQEKFLKKIQEIVKVHGVIIFTTPNFLLWNNRFRMLLGNFGLKEVFYDKGHIHLMSYNGFKEKLTAAGLQILEENNIWYPNFLERYKRFLPPNLFVFQTIVKVSKNQ